MYLIDQLSKPKKGGTSLTSVLTISFRAPEPYLFPCGRGTVHGSTWMLFTCGFRHWLSGSQLRRNPARRVHGYIYYTAHMGGVCSGLAGASKAKSKLM